MWINNVVTFIIFYIILTTPRASCSMKSLRAQSASTLVACSPVLPASQDTGSFDSSCPLTI